MAAIVYLDVDDEITSAAARIRALEDERIALVLPLGSRLATSRINFRLLAREAEARGKRIEVITNDASARALAASAGLPTHLSVAAFEAPPPPAPVPSDAPPPAAPPGRLPTEELGVPGAIGEQPAPAPRPRSEPRFAPARPAPAGPAQPPDDDSPTLAMPVIRPPAQQRPAVPQVGRRPPVRRWPIVAAAALVIGLIVVLGGAGFVLLPSAEIVVTPASDSVGPLELNVTAQSGVTQPDPVNLLVPATRFTFDVAATDTFPTTGIRVDETAATGEVTFSSLNTGSSNTIDRGAIVETQSGIEFRTLAEITLPPAEIGIVDGEFVVIPSTEKVAIEAVAIGVGGNVPANSIVVVPKEENPKRTTVTNDNATAGGSHTETKQVQQADIDAAMGALDAALAAEFERQIADRSGVPEGTTLFPETRSLGTATPSVDPATLIGTDADEFALGLTAQGVVIGVNPGPVDTLARARIRTAVDDGFRLVEDSIEVAPGTPIVAGSIITFPVTVRALEVRIVDAAALLERVRGLGLPQARTILEGYGTVTIDVWPDWVTTIPTLESRATISLGTPTLPSPSPGAAAAGVVP
jgi:hypothetical protein